MPMLAVEQSLLDRLQYQVQPVSINPQARQDPSAYGLNK